ncbi:hypothetical protein ACP70R_023626 [Stipagrostis hirtigluma subsp. patula]
MASARATRPLPHFALPSAAKPRVLLAPFRSPRRALATVVPSPSRPQQQQRVATAVPSPPRLGDMIEAQ